MSPQFAVAPGGNVDTFPVTIPGGLVGTIAMTALDSGNPCRR